MPKDGPSAGVTLATSLVSALTGIPVRQDVAMTGEITLRGRVLPVGGIKEKLLAAHMAGIGNILLPAENRPDLDDVPEEVREHLQIRAVERVDEVLSCALTRRPARWSDTALPKQGNAGGTQWKLSARILSFSLAQYGPYEGVGLPEIAIAGKSNVGKSSMINRVCTRGPARQGQRDAGQDAAVERVPHQ